MGKENIEGISNQIREYHRKGMIETVKCVFCNFCGTDKGISHI